jgi:hypothetical protein
MDNIDTLITLDTQDIRRRQIQHTKTKKTSNTDPPKSLKKFLLVIIFYDLDFLFFTVHFARTATE